MVRWGGWGGWDGGGGLGGWGGWGGWGGLVKKLNVTPKKKGKENNLCTTRPALLVKIQLTKTMAPSRSVTNYFYLLFKSGGYHERKVKVLVIWMRASLGGTESAGLCHLQYQYKKIQLTKTMVPSRSVTNYF